jgi:hypothetical protein
VKLKDRVSFLSFYQEKISKYNAIVSSNYMNPKFKTDSDRSASYIDLHLEIDSEWRLRTELYDTELISIFPL